MENFLEPTLLRLFIQLFLAALFGFAIGAERTIAGKNAGMRTFALVSLGSCLFVITSVVVTTSYINITTFDPMRVTAGIITGVGFIGAGLIVLRNNSLRGLTTAAGMWVAAGVGVAVGFGLYAIAFFATLMTLFIFTAVWFIEEKMRRTLGKDSGTIVEELTTTANEIDE